MIDKLRIARDLEGSVQDLIEGLSPSSPGRTEGKPQKVWATLPGVPAEGRKGNCRTGG
jgi:hypothetical protein